MSETKEDGGPAHPTFMTLGPDGYLHDGFHGMSLRDAFAIAALNGIMSKTTLISGKDIDAFKLFSEASYALADAMLKARKESQ